MQKMRKANSNMPEAFIPIFQKFPFIPQMKIHSTTAILWLNLPLYGFSTVMGCILHLCQNKIQERQNQETKLTNSEPEYTRRKVIPVYPSASNIIYIPTQ